MKKQKGFVLITAMVFLLVMTLLGTSVMSGTTLEEKMSGSFADRNIAIQASYSALAACEKVVEGWVGAPVPFDPTNGTDGLHLPSTTLPIFDPSNSNWQSTDVIEYDTLATALDIPYQPVCIIEHLGTVNTAIPPLPPVMKNNFRISAMGEGWNGSVYYTQSVLVK